MDAYQEFLLTVRRDINCLSESSGAVQKSAVTRLERALFSGPKVPPQDYSVRLYLEELHKPLMRLFASSSEKCREVSIGMTFRFVDIVPMAELENLLPLLLQALLSRFRPLPFPEQSEEIRLEALKLVRHVVGVCQARLNPFISDVVDALAKALTDTCPDAKKECCDIIKQAILHMDAERVSRAGGPLVGALLANLKHQHWKVRRATLDCLGALLCLEAPMLDHMEEALPHFGALLNDRHTGVRQCLAECLEKWLLAGLSFKSPQVWTYNDDPENAPGFGKFEHRLVLLLLSVAADEDLERVAPLALAGVERVAVRKHEARLQQAERVKEQVQKRAQVAESNGKKQEPIPHADERLMEVIVAPEFDYATACGTLPAPFTTGSPPAVLTTTYVQLHLQTCLPQVLSNLTQWTSDIRGSAARLLRVMLVIVNRQIAPFLDSVLVHLYKACGDDEEEIARAVLQCAGMVGIFVDTELLLGLVGKHLGLKLDGSTGSKTGEGVEELWPEARRGRQVTRTVQETDSGVKNFVAVNIENRRQVFTVLAHLLRPINPTASRRLQQMDVRIVVRFLEEGAASDELLPRVLRSAESLLAAGGPLCMDEWPRIFDVLLRMRSGEECEPTTVDKCMDSLADICGRTRQALYEEHLSTRLAELLMGAAQELWDERSPKRHVLETLLRNSGAAVAPHIGSLVPVLARQSSPEDASVPARIDILGLVHFLVTGEEPAMSSAIQANATALLDGVLVPNCTWKPGQSNNKIRKGGMVCIHSLLQRHLVEPKALNSAFADLMPILKSCLDDSFSPDNRMIAAMVLSCTLVELQEEINDEQLRDVYPELLKRLDDSNDKIRTTICEALAVFFKCLPARWSRSLYEYILKTLFVHLDDPNPEIQQGVYKALESGVHFDYIAFIQEAKLASSKSSHPRLCEELARLAESLRQASGDGDAEMS